MPKHIILLTYLQNVGNTSFDIDKLRLSHIRWTPYIITLSSLFILNQPLFCLTLNLPLPDHLKIDEKSIDSFLGRDIYCYMNIKNSLPE